MTPETLARPDDRLLDKIDVITERDGNIVEAFVPIELIDQEDVAVDAEHVEALARSMRNESNGSANVTGQLTPALLAEVPGENKFVILDGFHRTAALARNDEKLVYSTVKLECTPAEVIDIRIVAAKSHKKVKFSRIVEWVEDAWAQTEWSERIDVSSAFIMTLLNGSGRGRQKKENKLDDDAVNEIKSWVRQKCNEWDISVNHVDRYLRTAREADPQLVKRAIERRSGHRLEDITPMHLTKITKHLPGKYALQNVVASAAITNALTIPQTDALSLAISRADSYETMDGYIDMKIWQKMGAASKAIKKKRYGEIDANNQGEYTRVLRDKFFDDQIELGEALIENAILLARYTPRFETASPEVNSLVIRNGLENTVSLDEINFTDEATTWDAEKIELVAQKSLELQDFLIQSVRRKFSLINTEAAEDVVSEARIRLLERVSDGRLPQRFVDDEHLRRLMAKIVEFTAIDEIRKLRGRNGQKPTETSLDYKIYEDIALEDTLGEEDKSLEEIEEEAQDSDFIRNMLPFLNDRERRTLVLKGYFSLTSKECSQVLITTEATINQTFRGIKKRAEKLTKDSQLSLADIQ